MDYTRKIRIEYYQVVKAKRDGSGQDELFALENLIVVASKKTLEQRTYQYYQEEARLDKFYYNEILDVWYLNFVRLRQTKLPVKATKTEEATAMNLGKDEYIGEDVTAVYDCVNKIVAVQRNRDSLSSVGIEMYLTELYGKADEGIFLRPIPMKNMFDKAGKAKCVRKFVLKFASNKSDRRVLPANSSFKDLLNYFDRFETSKNAIVTISLGKGRKGSLDESMVRQTLQDLKECEGVIAGAEMSIKEREDAQTEIIDLFAMKYHSIIFMKVNRGESINFQECADTIWNKYCEKKEEILQLMEIA